jgi:preprotein translocase subunit SecF
MEFFRIKKDIPFMRHALVFNAISALTFVAAVFFLFYKGLHLSIEFTGGTAMEVTYAKEANVEGIRKTIESLGFQDTQVQNFGTAHDVMIRFPAKKDVDSAKLSQAVFAGLCAAEGATITPNFESVNAKGEKFARTACVGAAQKEPLVLQGVEIVGAQVGEELAQDGLRALLFVVIGIMIYLALRFEWKFAVSAIIANLHDVVIILGFFAFFQWEFSLTVLAAVLAVLGYSVNESVVVFDRVRETFRDRRYGKLATAEVMNHAITSTISRTIITHGCTQMMVMSMFFFGGQTLHFFSVALTIGILFGIYSSVFVAAAVAMWLGVKREDLLKPVKEKDTTDGAVV